MNNSRKSERIVKRRLRKYVKIIIILFALTLIPRIYLALPGLSSSVSDSLPKIKPNLTNLSVPKLKLDISALKSISASLGLSSDDFAKAQEYLDQGYTGEILLIIILLLDLVVIKANTPVLFASPTRRKKIWAMLGGSNSDNQERITLATLEQNVRLASHLKDKLKAAKSEGIEELIPIYERQFNDALKTINKCYQELQHTNHAWEARQCLDGMECDAETSEKVQKTG